MVKLTNNEKRSSNVDERLRRLTQRHANANVRKKMRIVQLRDEVETKIRIEFDVDVVETNDGQRRFAHVERVAIEQRQKRRFDRFANVFDHQRIAEPQRLFTNAKQSRIVHRDDAKIVFRFLRSNPSGRKNRPVENQRNERFYHWIA